jgi:hypothetical protein
MIPRQAIIDHEYHVVELYRIPDVMLDWCLEKFGEHGVRWFVVHHTKIYFTSSKDHMMFLLRWS